MEEELTIDDMYSGLMKGYKYVLKETLRGDWRAFQDGRLRYFVPGSFNSIVLDIEDDGTPIFCWSHYGSSAEKATKEDLEWLLKVIFKSEPSEFVKLDIHAVTDVINEGR